MDIAIIYEALANAETGGEANPWIRTKVIPKGGSSAFGPVQLTHGLISDALKRKLLSDKSIKFSNEVMLPMQEQFLKYGSRPNLTPEQLVYDYGGTGNFDSNYADAYKQLSNELIKLKVGDNNLEPVEIMKRWSWKEPDKGYQKRFMKKFKRQHYRKD